MSTFPSKSLGLELETIAGSKSRSGVKSNREILATRG